MAIVNMQKLSICANKKNRKAILETLQNLGTVEIFTDKIEDEDLQVMDTQVVRAKYEKRAESFDKVLKLLEAYAPEKSKGGGLFGGKEYVRRAKMDRIVQERYEYNKEAAQILSDDREINERRGIILKDQNQIESLQPWIRLGIPMDTTGTKKTAVMIGTLPDTYREPEVYAAAAKDLPEPAPVTAQVLSSNNGETYICVVCLARDAAKLAMANGGCSKATKQALDALLGEPAMQ